MATFFAKKSLACKIPDQCVLYELLALTSALMGFAVSVPVKARMLRNDNGSCSVMSPRLSLTINL